MFFSGKVAAGIHNFLIRISLLRWVTDDDTIINLFYILVMI